MNELAAEGKITLDVSVIGCVVNGPGEVKEPISV